MRRKYLVQHAVDQLLIGNRIAEVGAGNSQKLDV